ncbi:aminotransferase class V-fold PLP-dependent enzyme [Sphingomonas sp. BK580]|uniref:aminotransferase class V-fold PLP-dependent enzyme n=1 Tax=Sphingomonas sp. BK580 TaxID=2586972 RepID=UPI00160FA520|nr:aminotransferase class V-fold PLP-dependent enzyme [Sphingomonas sp. BK580]MBB3693601.1 selenocysteine lyase/cysteine desulfurase [Sphingomonas sp. BK580]
MAHDAVSHPGRYFATAASGLMSAEVLGSTMAHLRLEAELGAPAAAARSMDAVARGYAAAGELLGADADEIALVESGNRGLQALIQSVDLKPGDHVLVDRTCWGGTLAMLASLSGVVVDVMPVDDAGVVDVAAARRSADPRTRLVVLTWIPATCGVVNPAEDVGALSAELGACYFVDACQVVGQRPVDVASLRCDGLVSSGRKWLGGPRGTAVLYASRRFLDATRPFMPDQFGAGRTDARRYETGEANLAGRVGLAAALLSYQAAESERSARMAAIADDIRRRAAAATRAYVVERGARLADFVTLAGFDVAKAASDLARAGVTVSVPTREYAPLDMDSRRLAEVMRIAPHPGTTLEDVEVLFDALSHWID